jgi:hypothetical protein
MTGSEMVSLYQAGMLGNDMSGLGSSLKKMFAKIAPIAQVALPLVGLGPVGSGISRVLGIPSKTIAAKLLSGGLTKVLSKPTASQVQQPSTGQIKVEGDWAVGAPGGQRTATMNQQQYTDWLRNTTPNEMRELGMTEAQIRNVLEAQGQNRIEELAYSWFTSKNPTSNPLLDVTQAIINAKYAQKYPTVTQATTAEGGALSEAELSVLRQVYGQSNYQVRPPSSMDNPGYRNEALNTGGRNTGDARGGDSNTEGDAARGRAVSQTGAESNLGMMALVAVGVLLLTGMGGKKGKK